MNHSVHWHRSFFHFMEGLFWKNSSHIHLTPTQEMSCDWPTQAQGAHAGTDWLMLLSPQCCFVCWLSLTLHVHSTQSELVTGCDYYRVMMFRWRRLNEGTKSTRIFQSNGYRYRSSNKYDICSNDMKILL